MIKYIHIEYIINISYQRCITNNIIYQNTNITDLKWFKGKNKTVKRKTNVYLDFLYRIFVYFTLTSPSPKSLFFIIEKKFQKKFDVEGIIR